MRDWILAETNYGRLKDNPCDVAVLPMGATEPHNLHLPYGTDTYQSLTIAELACETAFRRGARVVMLPAIPFGTQTNMREFPLAVNLMPSTLAAVIGDVVDSLAQSGIEKLVVLNGHGGNDFKPVLRELYGQTPVHVFLCDWFCGLSADVQRTIFDDPGDHAGEMETSLMLAYFGDLVATDDDGRLRADDGEANPTRFEAVENRWVTITRPWHLLTTNAGCGNPHSATADKGRKLMETLVERLSAFLVQLADEPVDERFPY
ncbi:MAG: creatininase family protein [Planctomycetaceae bacterium]